MSSAPPSERPGVDVGVSPAARLAPYVPRLALEWLRDCPQQRHRQVDGSVAFVDISGFTNLTERLSRKGKVGAEEMNQILNACFAEFLNSAYDFGAGVIKWGGDAVLLLFQGDDHQARAARAAWEMQRTMDGVGRIRTGSETVTLKMSIGISSGLFDFFLVGDVHRELVITGPCATETVAMEGAADAGEIALSPATAAAIDSRYLGEPKGPAILLRRGPRVATGREGWIVGVEDLNASSLVPVAVAEHLLAGGGEPEHRPLTAAFIHFMGVDERLAAEGSEAVADALETTISAVERISLDHGIAFFDTDIYQSGGKIMLMGGAPSSTGADEERMLRAMRKVVEADLPLPLRIGVNYGRIFVGDFGPQYRRTYTVTGDAVNLAARLMAKAEPGQILTTDEVLERSRSRFDTVALEPFQAKGKSEPVQAYVVGPPLGLKERGGAGTSLVGRDQELAVLVEALDHARRYEGRIVEIVAEPGMGKSRLVEELLTRSQNVRIHTVQCEEYEASTPYFAFRRLLLDVLAGGVEDAAQVASLLRQRVEAMAPHLEPWLPLLGVPLGVELPDTPETAPLGDEFRKARIEEVTRELLGMTLLDPTVIVYDDTHWMDDASADLLRALTEGLEQRPWLFLVTRRDQPTGFAAPEEASPVVLRLQPLDPTHAAALAIAATDEVPFLPHEIEALAERAGGNPLFLTELIAAAREGQGIAELPDSVESLMMARIDRLTPTDRRVLRCAAVVGGTFQPSLVEAALQGDGGDESVWSRLGEFVVEEEGAMRFRHALVRDAAYEGLPFRRRRELHARVGETIEGAAADPEDEAALLSLHFFHAHEFVKAWRYSRIAGERAQAIYANVEAAAFFDRALASARRRRGILAEDRAAVLEGLGDVLVRLSEFDRAARVYQSSRRQRHADPVGEARVYLKEAQVPSWLGKLPQALRCVTRGLSVLGDLDDPLAGAERARLHALYAAVRTRQGRLLDAIRWCDLAVEEAKAANARDALAHAYFLLDWAYASLGRYEEATYSPLALSIYEELGNLHRQGLVLNNMGVFAHFQGRWDDALELYGRAEEAWAKLGDRWHVALATLNRGEVLADQGHVEDAEPLLRSALRVARASHSAPLLGDVTLRLGRLLSRSGRFEEAHALLTEARAQYELEADARIAECLVLEGDRAAALELSSSALARAQSLDGGFDVRVMLHRTQGSALLQLGRAEDARAALERALDEGRRRSLDYEVALVLDVLALLADATGEPADAQRRERDTLLERLGVVAIPKIPLPGRVRITT